ncbi:hypothetical protein [Serratia sp. OS31]|uniref:hypothetical protein n=1 Tax=Serratia sp. OS31 TaxID=2760844 RepID=UPI0021054C7C|nr:hypothetical protein [Serratia sp. OS31]
MDASNGLEYILSLHGTRVNREDGYWWKIEAWKVTKTAFIPHGIRYNMTLHDKYNTRVFGIDIAHAIKVPKGDFQAEYFTTTNIRRPRIKARPMSFIPLFSWWKISSLKSMKS